MLGRFGEATTAGDPAPAVAAHLPAGAQIATRTETVRASAAHASHEPSAPLLRPLCT